LVAQRFIAAIKDLFSAPASATEVRIQTEKDFFRKLFGGEKFAI